MLKPGQQILKDAYSIIDSNERQCLSQQYNDWDKAKPLRGRKILLNVHITTVTLVMIDNLLAAGADVEVCATPELVVHSTSMGKNDALTPIKRAGLTYHPDGNIPSDKREKYYDVVFDCGAGLLGKVTPKVGMIELTHTDPKIYAGIDYPVVTVDTSRTKEIETKFGTGDGLKRVIDDLAKKAMRSHKLNLPKLASNDPTLAVYYTLLKMADPSVLYSKNRYIIFGYGKVGKGIALALRKAAEAVNTDSRAITEQILCVDVDDDRTLEASGDYSTFHLQPDDPRNIAELREKLKEADYIITATGVEGCLSKYFTPVDCNGAILANMGTPDEFGEKFDPNSPKIINRKKPANFSLEYPTKVLYLDPIFKLLLSMGDMLCNNLHPDIKDGLNDVPAAADREILRQWQKFYPAKMLGQYADEYAKLLEFKDKLKNVDEENLSYPSDPDSDEGLSSSPDPMNGNDSGVAVSQGLSGSIVSSYNNIHGLFSSSIPPVIPVDQAVASTPTPTPIRPHG